jgi:hypothetical protein
MRLSHVRTREIALFSLNRLRKQAPKQSQTFIGPESDNFCERLFLFFSLSVRPDGAGFARRKAFWAPAANFVSACTQQTRFAHNSLKSERLARVN